MAINNRFWVWPWEMKQHGLLGINARNLNMLFRQNDRSRYPMVDNKVLTKEICRRYGIRTPETYAVISRYGDIKNIRECLKPYSEAVIKPAHGSGGEGILLLKSLCSEKAKTPDGSFLSEVDIRYHISGILSGLYSLGGQTDSAIIEQYINLHPVFSRIIGIGMPDIRIITFKCRPVMSMLRLPTQTSKGKANLHQGGVGVGVNIEDGITTHAIHNGQIISCHPDTGVVMKNIKIPFWDDILDIAIRFSKAVEMGYIGVDIVIEAVNGPVVLEANARPGLSIQLANRFGLLTGIHDCDEYGHTDNQDTLA